MTLHLHIDRIILHDVPPGSLDRAQLQLAVQQELGRALTASTMHRWRENMAVPDLPVARIEVDHRGLAAGIAGGVAGALSGLGGHRP